MDYKKVGGGLVKRQLERYWLLKVTTSALSLICWSVKKKSLSGITVGSVSSNGIKLTANIKNLNWSSLNLLIDDESFFYL